MGKYTRILFCTVFLFALLLLVPSLSLNQVSAASKTQYRQSNAVWKSTTGARTYNVYYKEKGAKQYQHAVGNLPASSVKITIGGLKIGTAYVYNVSAVNIDGKEFWWSGEKPL